jgi:hypothetical protein
MAEGSWAQFLDELDKKDKLKRKLKQVTAKCGSEK